MTTALYILRAKQLGLTIEEMDLLSEGMIYDMITESQNDTVEDAYTELATQEDFDNF
ncbi:MAG: hypothetical protein IKH82_03255 [Clostridiales bacterium]|jgi:hypothetical protein|nr:hypothetical protein [Mogibacterium sp.]MBR6987068.1 hypothetical protein [Clostridiales bacterium]